MRNCPIILLFDQIILLSPISILNLAVKRDLIVETRDRVFTYSLQSIHRFSYQEPLERIGKAKSWKVTQQIQRPESKQVHKLRIL